MRKNSKIQKKTIEPIKVIRTIKLVHNRNEYKIELVHNNKVIVIPPHKSVEVPNDFVAPENIGLSVTEHKCL